VARGMVGEGGQQHIEHAIALATMQLTATDLDEAALASESVSESARVKVRVRFSLLARLTLILIPATDPPASSTCTYIHI